MEWFKIRSWHGTKDIGTFTSRANIDFTYVKSYCGQKRDFRTDEVDTKLFKEFNMSEKTCESCLRNMSLLRHV